MKNKIQATARLGDLITTVFDEASSYSSDPREVSLIASKTVEHMLRHMHFEATSQPSEKVQLFNLV